MFHTFFRQGGLKPCGLRIIRAGRTTNNVQRETPWVS